VSDARRRYVGEMVRHLWPEPAVVTLHGRTARLDVTSIGPAGSEPIERHDWVAVPRLDDVRFLVPRRPRAAASGALRNFRASASGTARLKVELTGLALRLGLGDLLPDRVSVGIPRGELGATADSLDVRLARAVGEPVLVAIYVGPPRAVQKPVLQLLSRHGEPLAFAKLATNELTRELLEHEAATLAMLAQRALRALAAPQILQQGDWSGHFVLVQKAVPRRGAAPVAAAALQAATLELAALDGLERTPLASSTYWHDLSGRVAALSASSAQATIAEAVAMLDNPGDNPGDRTTELTFGCWHGDWAPWNMVWLDDRVVAWDWEHFRGGVPVGFDAVHHRLQRLVVDDGLGAVQAWTRLVDDGEATFAGLPVRASDRALVTLLYALEIATRYIEDDEVGVADTRLSRLDDWLATAIGLCTTRLGRPA
jgi:hypothetical protein